MVKDDLQISQILKRENFENAIKTNAAVGGSTNAVIHLLALAGRIGVPLCLDDFDRLASELPCLVNLQPSGKYLMEDYYYAGGLPAVLREMGENGALHRDATTANGKSIWRTSRKRRAGIVKSFSPIKNHSKPRPGPPCCAAIWRLDGAVYQVVGGESRTCFKHRGCAVVFEIDRRISHPASKTRILILTKIA